MQMSREVYGVGRERERDESMLSKYVSKRDKRDTSERERGVGESYTKAHKKKPASINEAGMVVERVLVNRKKKNRKGKTLWMISMVEHVYAVST